MLIVCLISIITMLSLVSCGAGQCRTAMIVNTGQMVRAMDYYDIKSDTVIIEVNEVTRKNSVHRSYNIYGVFVGIIPPTVERRVTNGRNNNSVKAKSSYYKAVFIKTN